jgi:RNA polymerase sigma-70 factor (ECF subfamily)
LPDSDAALVMAVRAGREDGLSEIVRRCGPDVDRILRRLLGPDPELEDLAHEVFVAAFLALDQLRDPHALRSWLVGIAVRKARKLIGRRKRWSFIRSVAPADLPEHAASASSPDLSDALRSTYRILSALPVDDQIAFALRQIDGMELTAVAEVTAVSLATAKRRIARARRRFVELARRNEELAPWVRDDVEGEP